MSEERKFEIALRKFNELTEEEKYGGYNCPAYIEAIDAVESWEDLRLISVGGDVIPTTIDEETAVLNKLKELIRNNPDEIDYECVEFIFTGGIKEDGELHKYIDGLYFADFTEEED